MKRQRTSSDECCQTWSGSWAQTTQTLLAARFSIAQEMAARGDHTAAENEFRDVLPHLERNLGPDHPVTLILWFNIAQRMVARGDHAGARDEFRDMLPHLRRRLGPQHPDTLAAAKWIDSMQENR